MQEPPGVSRIPSLLRSLRRPELIYSLVLFASALVALGAAVAGHGFLPDGHGPAIAVFFVVFGLLTISMGYTHPRLGYVSFDRVAQIAAILVLGPVAAAILNGIASLLYPLHRLFKGRSVTDVLIASLHNAGLMALLILVAGLAYQKFGGPVPLLELGARELLLLPLLLLLMQALNEVAMRVLIAIEERRLQTDFSPFAYVVEFGAGLGGIIVAIVLNRMELPVVALLLLVLSLGMLSLTELARIRERLELLVEERTRRLREKTLELERIATHDPLTGLHNRRYADEHLDERIGEFDRYGRHFSVALVDLDHFKSVNDNHSHEAGDEVLRAVSAILREQCRDTDMVARYGGEEFLLCFPQADLAAARDACEKIRVVVEETDWGLLAPGVQVTLSAGVASMQRGLVRRSLLSAADQALYEAKAAGRNRVRLAGIRGVAGTG